MFASQSRLKPYSGWAAIQSRQGCATRVVASTRVSKGFIAHCQRYRTAGTVGEEHGMEIKSYGPGDLPKLLGYWYRLAEDIPYFYPVSADRWQACLLRDELDGERTFDDLETYFLAGSDGVLGFVQFGQPSFGMDETGRKYYDPDIGVIRHLYFDRDRVDVGNALLAKAEDGLARFPQLHAFYHILGMSCNAFHGKLHSSQDHVERLLCAHGFSTEHQNVFYELDMVHAPSTSGSGLHVERRPGSSEEDFALHEAGEATATARVRYLDAKTDGYTRDVVYLSWLGVREQDRGKGKGTELVRLLTGHLLDQGYRYLHTDTADDNVGARRFYEKLGFRSKGYTRSYVRRERRTPAPAGSESSP